VPAAFQAGAGRQCREGDTSWTAWQPAWPGAGTSNIGVSYEGSPTPDQEWVPKGPGVAPAVPALTVPPAGATASTVVLGQTSVRHRVARRQNGGTNRRYSHTGISRQTIFMCIVNVILLLVLSGELLYSSDSAG